MSARDSWLRKSGFAIGVGALALVLLVSALATYAAGAAALRQRSQVDATRASLTAVVSLRAAVAEAEAGADDYVLSGGVTGVTLYQSARTQVSDDASQITAPPGVEARVNADVAQVRRLAPVFLADLQSVMALERAGRTAEATRQLGAGPVERDARSLLSAITQIQAIENSLLLGQVTSAEEAQRLVTIIAVISALLDIGSLVALVFVLRRTSLLREQYAGERARAEEQTRIMALEETNRRMKDFLGIASHELRTPLTSLKIGLRLTEREIRRLSEEARARGTDAGLEAAWAPLDRAIAATAQLERLAADLVDAARIEAGTLGLRQTALDLEPLLADCVEEQRLYHPGRVITLSAPDRAIIALADDDRIRQVVTNYLTNAIKFSDEKRPVKVRLSADAREAMVRVRDEGPGISPEEVGHIWDQFYRAPGIMHRTGSSEGFGLGLYICKSIIEQHGGKVGVESVVGQGSTFWFTLPLAVIPEAQPASPEAQPASSAGLGGLGGGDMVRQRADPPAESP